ncbi:TIGR04372 family glycosyltransferase [bacterium 1xD8-48]|nr:TIGR04372 family glycosyltransferase [bacterium 1xD8-48]
MKKKVYIWGTGHEAEKCILEISTERCQIMGFVETKPHKQTWKDRKVYASEILPQLKFDYIIIANTYYDEIINDIRERKLVDDIKIINWMKIKACIYHYDEKIWILFSEKFLKDNFYIINSESKQSIKCLPKSIYEYKKIYVYDLRLINRELDIGILFAELINNLKTPDIGMAFIPSEDYQDESWYHNLLFILDKKAFVIWKESESAYLEYIKTNPEKFSFEKFGILQFVREEKRTVHKGRYMLFDTKTVYDEKHDLIQQANRIKIYHLRCDRIGEEVRVLNKILSESYDEKDDFTVYIPVDAYGRPFEGTNVCFNELISRQLNLLKNKEEYALWIQDIFEKNCKYEYDRAYRLPGILEFRCGARKTYQPWIDFKDDELVMGKNLITDRLGLIKDYVCLFIRDAEYLKKTFPNEDCSYHDYRDSSFDVMKKTIDYFECCNMQTIRMGQITEPGGNLGKCIDFANQGYDEFLDLIIHRFCKFFVGTASGVVEISNVFGRPAVWMLPYYPQLEFSVFCVEKNLCIFNRIYNIAKGRELSFSEIFDMTVEFRKNPAKSYFIERGLEIIPFSEEDILNAAIEMNNKLDEIWEYSDDDIRLHKIFNLKLKSSMEKHNIDNSYIVPISIATSYLRKYKYLLED